MLSFFRNNAGSLLLKIFLSVLAITFIFGFGIGDIIRKLTGQDFVIKIGSEKILKPHFDILMHDKINLIKKSQKNEQLDENLISTYALRQILYENLEKYSLTNLGFIISDNITVEYIQGFSQFSNKDGHFDSNLLRSFLHNVNISESNFIDYTRQQLSVMFLRAPLALLSPNKQLALFIKADKETRSIRLIEIFSSTMKDYEAVTDVEIENLYKKEQNLYLTKERRNFTFFTLDEADIRKNIKISDGELKELYANSIYKDQEFESVKEYLKDEHIREVLENEISKIKANVEDEMVKKDLTDEELQKIASKYNLKCEKVENITDGNLDTKDNKILKYGYAPYLLDKVFNESHDVPTFTSAPDKGDSIVHFITYLHKIIPGSVLPLSDVKEKITEKCVRVKQDKRAKQVATELVLKINGAKTAVEKESIFDDFSKKYYIPVVKLEPFSRLGPVAKDNYKVDGLTKKSVDDSFLLNQFDSAYSKFGSGYSVVQVLEIHDYEKVTKDDEEKYAKTLSECITNDLYESMISYLYSVHDCKINKALIKGSAGGVEDVDMSDF